VACIAVPLRSIGASLAPMPHPDIPMGGCSLFLDGEPVVTGGDVVVEGMRRT